MIRPRSARRMEFEQRPSMKVTLAALVVFLGGTATSMNADELNVSYQCFDRKTNQPIAASSIDLSTSAIKCESITPDIKPEKPTEATEKVKKEEKPDNNTDINTPPAIITTIDFEKQSWQALPTQTEEEVNNYPRNFPLAARRAINLARGSAVALNGGLRIYRPGSCMFKSAVNNPCLVHASRDGFQFLVPGGIPGWEQSSGEPETVTRVWVSGDGRSLLNASKVEQKQSASQP